MVRSPTGIKATAAQLTELHQQQFRQQRQQQEQLPTEQQQQQQSTKGQRSHRVRKSKVPAVAKVIAESDMAREVQNAVDMSHNEDSGVPHRTQQAAGMS